MTVLFLSLALALFLGVPVALAIAASVLMYLLVDGSFPIDIFVQRGISGVNSFPLLALPLFIFAGHLMELGVTERLIRFADNLVGWMRGGLAAVSVVTSGMFGAVAGSGVATVAAVGSVIQPAMVKRGYSPGFTIALQGTAGGLGFLIPPSITMVIFAVAGELSVGQALIAGLIPGIILTIVLAAVAMLASRRYNFKSAETKFDLKSLGTSFISAAPAFGLPIVVVGGIFGGIFTPTEAAAVAVLYAAALGAIYRNLTISTFRSILIKSVRTSSIILPIVAFSAALAWIITIEQVPSTVVNWMNDIADDSQGIVILLVMVFLLILGTFMETTAIILMTTPVFLPVVMAAGLDPLVYAVLMTVMLMLGGVTPPLAVGLFTAASIIKERVEASYRYLLWFIIPLLLTSFVFYWFPEITTYLTERT